MICVDLFCGAGGMSEGLERAGITVAAACDVDTKAAKTYSMNASYETDVYTCEVSKMPRHPCDLVVGGPPCQGFSTVGKKDIADPRNDLLLDFMQYVEDVEPKYVLFENVKGFTNMYSGVFHKMLMEEFARLGYQVDCGVLNAVMYGVPQNRKRFIALGSKDGKRLPSGCKAPWSSFDDATSDLWDLESGQGCARYRTPPTTKFQEYVRAMRYETVTHHSARNHSPELLERIRTGGEGAKSFANSYKRIQGFQPAPTITRNFQNPGSGPFVHPRQDRGLTIREGARLQSFPDHYEFFGGFGSIALQIGNAVPPLLAYHLGKELLK